MLWLSVVSFVWSVGTAGIGFLIGGFAIAIHSVRLVQEELNLYGDDGVAHSGHS